MVILVGRPEIVHKMVQNNRQTKRYTGLAHMLSEEGNGYASVKKNR